MTSASGVNITSNFADISGFSTGIQTRFLRVFRGQENGVRKDYLAAILNSPFQKYFLEVV